MYLLPYPLGTSSHIVLEPGQYHLGDGSDVCGAVNENFSYAVLPELLSSGRAGNTASPTAAFPYTCRFQPLTTDNIKLLCHAISSYSNPPTVKRFKGPLWPAWQPGPRQLQLCCTLFQRLIKHSHLASRTSRGPGREGEPCPSAPVPPPAKRWHSPRCPAGCTWLPRLPRARVRDDQLVLRRLGPDPPDVPALGRERKREEREPRVPRPACRAARAESGRGTLRLPLASFLLGRVFHWGAATAGPRPSPRPHASRAPRGRARGWCPSPRRPGAGPRPVPPSHPPHSPRCTPKPGFGGSRWRSHPAGREREAGTGRGGRRLRGLSGPSACLLCLYTPRKAAGGRGGRRAGEERARASERARGGRGGAGRAGGLGGAEPSLHCV